MINTKLKEKSKARQHLAFKSYFFFNKSTIVKITFSVKIINEIHAEVLNASKNLSTDHILSPKILNNPWSTLLTVRPS